jgi:hypothetical protein
MASAKSRSAGAVSTGFDSPTISSICTRPRFHIGSRDRAAHGHAHAHAAYHPALQHHFESMPQQKEAAVLGMCTFLLTEILFFGGLFMHML